MRTRIGLAALPAALLLALAGCAGENGSGNADDTVASSDESDANGGEGGDGDGNGEPLSDEELRDLLLEYAQCLRDEGLDVEDPAPGEGIAIRNEGDPSQADAALAACEDLAPPPPPEAEQDSADEQGRENMLGFAQCMRDNGVEAFEDPRPEEGLHIGPEVAEDPDFKSAERTCNEKFFGEQPQTQKQDA